MNEIWSDPQRFLRQSWESHNAEGHAEQKANQINLDYLYNLISNVPKTANKKLLEELLTDVVKAMRDYAESMQNTSNYKDSEAGIMAPDQQQHRAHERLLDALKILARNCAKNGINDEWLDKIGTDREDIGLWAINEINKQH